MTSSNMDPALAIEQEASSIVRLINDQIDRGDSAVQKFYRGVTVFVTGGTGFIGKQLIEKLFRSCAIKKMYLLMRQKKGKTVQERLQQILTEPVFDQTYKKHPCFSDRIEPLEGDIAKIQMGLNDEQWRQLTEEVHIIFHIAATIKFNEPLREATLTNVRGTREVLELASNCRECKSFVYVSTAFTHTTIAHEDEEIMEQLYPFPVPPNLLIKLVEDVDENRVKDITEDLIKGWPNTYTFTKAAAEELIRTTAGDLPVCIVRPPLVLPAQHEPAPGWLDASTVYGPSGMVLGAILGVIHVLLVSKLQRIAIAPVDFVNNNTIVAPWDAAERRRNGDEKIPVYIVTNKNCCLSFHMVKESSIKYKKDVSTPKAVWQYGTVLTNNKYLYRVLTWFLHYLPAYLLDMFCDLSGSRPTRKNIKSFVKIFKKLDELLAVYSFFLFRNHNFRYDNITAMINKMSDEDRLIFNCDLSKFDMNVYVPIWIIGIRKYIIKDGLTGTRAAYNRQFIYRIISYTFLFVVIYIMWKVCNFV